ncbi:MAG: flavin reductase [Schwartzia sp.]|nr:flavin reductase [Schwartzia sp. (in: firmicutes)]
MNIQDFPACPFTKFDKDWALLTAGTQDDFNSMTISWGGMGTIWGKPVVFLFVKPVRYTHEFVSRHDEITVSFYDGKYKKALGIFGSKSGRDTDKPKAAGLTPKPLAQGVTYEEAKETLVCRKLYMQPMDKDAIPEACQASFYSLPGETQSHSLVIAEVLEIQ